EESASGGVLVAGMGGMAGAVTSALVEVVAVSPQPPSPFWTLASQEIVLSRPPVASAARRATTLYAVVPGQPWKEPFSARRSSRAATRFSCPKERGSAPAASRATIVRARSPLLVTSSRWERR